MDLFDDVDRQSAAVLVAALITAEIIKVPKPQEGDTFVSIAEIHLDVAEALARVRQEHQERQLKRLGR
jgi:hypothetical protein